MFVLVVVIVFSRILAWNGRAVLGREMTNRAPLAMYFDQHQSGKKILSIGSTNRLDDPLGTAEVDALAEKIGSKAARRGSMERQNRYDVAGLSSPVGCN